LTGRRRTASPYPPRVHAKHGALYYVVRGKWEQLVRGTEWNAAAAQTYARRIGTPAPAGTFGALAAEYLEEHGPDMAARTRADALAEIERLNRVFGRMRPGAIKPEHVGQYKRLRGKVARVRCNRELTRLRQILAFGLETGWVAHNAAAGIKPWRERPRDRLITDEEYAVFRTFALAGGEGDRVCFVCMELAYLTTQRRAAILGLRLADLSDEGIAFAPMKGGERVLVRWTERLRAAVDLAKSVRTVARLSAYLICNRRGKPYTDSGIKAMWNRLQVRWQAAGHERFHFHDLRARGVSKLKEQGRQAREISGHRTEATAERVYDRRRVRKGEAVE